MKTPPNTSDKHEHIYRKRYGTEVEYCVVCREAKANPSTAGESEPISDLKEVMMETNQYNDLRAAATRWKQDESNIVLADMYEAVIEFITWLEAENER